MFTPERSEEVRRRLLDRARDDPHIVGAGLTGSSAVDEADEWSDIDLFFGVAGDVAATVDEWSTYLYADLGALHHFELTAPTAVYRAFLLSDGLEVDLGFTPSVAFGALGPRFRLVFGDAIDRPFADPQAEVDHHVGLSWHHALHARAAIARGRPWQAEHWIAELREHTIALASIRLGLPHVHARGTDRLPRELHDVLAQTLVRSLDEEELRRALHAAVALSRSELSFANPALAARLDPLLATTVEE